MKSMMTAMAMAAAMGAAAQTEGALQAKVSEIRDGLNGTRSVSCEARLDQKKIELYASRETVNLQAFSAKWPGKTGIFVWEAEYNRFEDRLTIKLTHVVGSRQVTSKTVASLRVETAAQAELSDLNLSVTPEAEAAMMICRKIQ